MFSNFHQVQLAHKLCSLYELTLINMGCLGIVIQLAMIILNYSVHDKN